MKIGLLSSFFFFAAAALVFCAIKAEHDLLTVVLWVTASLIAGLGVAQLFNTWQPVRDDAIDERHVHRPDCQ